MLALTSSLNLHVPTHIPRGSYYFPTACMRTRCAVRLRVGHFALSKAASLCQKSGLPSPMPPLFTTRVFRIFLEGLLWFIKKYMHWKYRNWAQLRLWRREVRRRRRTGGRGCCKPRREASLARRRPLGRIPPARLRRGPACARAAVSTVADRTKKVMSEVLTAPVKQKS